MDLTCFFQREKIGKELLLFFLTQDMYKMSK